ncbi:MAG: FadR family transcriptional regulator [Chloroflexia bacterium]|jgi:GntR family transcriptional repressor for pyruvate dehydrogenase complex|nr:FadR family transcriptional regulator [Chloroflexia bacterium]
MTEGYVIEPIRKSRLSQKIVIQICDLIRNGQVLPGNRLPSERELAEKLQVSRASLREALSALEVSGLIETRHGGGTYVRDFYEFGVTSPLALVLSTSNEIIGDLWEVRLIFEPAVAARAAVRATAAEIETMHDILRQHSAYLDRIDGSDLLVDLDRTFHTTIARASRNQVSVRVLQLTNELLAESRRNYVSTPERRQLTYIRHTEIVTAIENRKPQVARDAMLAHLEEIERALLGEFVEEEPVIT